MQRAEVLFDEGLALLEAKRFAEALAKFEESHKLDPAPGTMFNIATCEEGLGRFATAARRWKEGFALLPADDSRRASAQANAAEADGKAGHLVLRLGPQSPAGTTVSLGGRALSASELSAAIAVDPGTHALVVSAPGYEKRELTATTASGETKELVVSPGPATATATSSAPLLPTRTPLAPMADSASSKEPGFFAQHPLSMGLLGTGVALAAFGTGLSIEILDKYEGFSDRCLGSDTSRCAPGEVEAMNNRTLGVNALFITAGAAGLASALVFVFVEDGLSIKPKKPARQVSVAAGPGGLSLTLRQ